LVIARITRRGIRDNPYFKTGGKDEAEKASEFLTPQH
jgi:hypothetical protein